MKTLAIAKLTLAERIEHSYFVCTQGVADARVWLSDLRRQLPDVPRRTLDAELLRLEREAKVVLSGRGDGLEPEQLDGVLFTPSGNLRSTVYMGGRYV